MTWNQTERILFSNIGAITTANFNLRGGNYWIETLSTGSGTINLQRRNPDGATFIARITQITASPGQQTIILPGGVYRWVVSGFTANYLEIVRIPSAVE